ncbi:SDR family NAD(P)-dependent oxidoreductase [Paenirhodobacter populi]|uniref:SDR family NAD(P)-dependent oxidoreductase n=1 Tax=Paenirhodobacter populi TaxID=2306993 RepID=A0A443J7V2_9RHOB|nr:SDR family NAD(P)-dependent oxidoreductase [Sinirhodobacter populi]RWR05595.1 SDR family NAD(P)-dependent oxidoreductase [Sinirhodobacter populi]RWR16544.1 SDR family NAD(P)-dependent oxidoreductase [Sinirhodobacter populi]
MGFAGKTVWIIGASDGIGAALARALAREGTRLILSARNQAALDALADTCGDARVLPLDLAEAGSLTDAVATIAPGTLDAVICTAALYDPGRVEDLNPETAARLVKVNLLGSFEVARLAPPLLRDGGQLVLFGSVAGYFGLPGGQLYSATKAAVNNLAETLRIELAPRVDVRLVCPGFVSTRLTAKNDFSMPAIITADQAAKAVIRGLEGRAFELNFPKRFTWTIKCLRALPYALSLRLSARLGVRPSDR